MQTRRKMLAAMMVAPAAIVAPTLANISADADIYAAWKRMCAADVAIAAMGNQALENPEMSVLWDARSDADEVIQAATAKTPLGVEMQLWCHFFHSEIDTEDNAAVLRRDLPHFAAKERLLDWNERLVLSAIRSLRAMGGAA